mmetsp:Transcript_37358/g.86216  ORF Transcript_37358/g.86216 Transcript_37358/m.86216 type:complete len:173 (-) Transcript_37358:8-526(-)
MAPIMEVRVLADVYVHLLSAGASTDWGMDVVWCHYASLRFGSNQTHDRACMVINNDFRKANRVTAQKNYFKTYSHSYEHEDALYDIACIKQLLEPLVAKFQSKECAIVKLKPSPSLPGFSPKSKGGSSGTHDQHHPHTHHAGSRSQRKKSKRLAFPWDERHIFRTRDPHASR